MYFEEGLAGRVHEWGRLSAAFAFALCAIQDPRYDLHISLVARGHADNLLGLLASDGTLLRRMRPSSPLRKFGFGCGRVRATFQFREQLAELLRDVRPNVLRGRKPLQPPSAGEIQNRRDVLHPVLEGFGGSFEPLGQGFEVCSLAKRLSGSCQNLHFQVRANRLPQFVRAPLLLVHRSSARIVRLHDCLRPARARLPRWSRS
jgi:hypothetical protein